MRKSAVLILIAAMFIALVATSVIAAQQGRGAGAGRNMQGIGSGQMAAALNLTDAQKAQIQAITEQYRPLIKQVRDSNMTPEQKQAQIQDLRKGMRSKIMAVLTPEQQQKAKKMWQQGAPQREKFQQALKSLNLTPDQQTQIAAIRKQSAQEAQAIKQDTSLSDTARQAKLQDLRKNTREQIMCVLTPEQKAKLKQMGPKMGQGKAQGR